MTAYLEKYSIEWFDDYVYTANQPLIRRGIKVQPFEGTFIDEFVEAYTFHEDDIVIGSVESTIGFWNKLGITVPKYIGYPNELKEYFDRNIYTTTYGALKGTKLPIFVKPKNDVKLFTGFVIDNSKRYNNALFLYNDVLDNDTEVYVSDVYKIDSEYRFFIHKGKCVGVKHYDGDWTICPTDDTFFFVDKIIADFKDAPVAYTLDISISKDEMRPHRLIEINDFWWIWFRWESLY